uniref:Uncharacterized protein n=1 Tax=Lepeophtheirus salmonis TaxID=72036 RepID=A0A0K2T1R7_LEPSM
MTLPVLVMTPKTMIEL